MFSSVLIANRGEIACRVIKTARKKGLRTIAIYSDADRSALHVRCADEAHAIGPAPAADSYLKIDAVLDAAKRSGAEAIHPGYGFLSENAEFAEACAEAGIVFIGPKPASIRAMGLKDQAKALMQDAGVPIVPGFHGERQDPNFLREKAYEIGYPVLIKAVAGGGGKGMRRVDRQIDFNDALAACIREAEKAFGDRRVLIERFVDSPRHIEIQVFGDSHGNVIQLGERDCSLQRRHQKIIEEAPAPGMTPGLRALMGEAAILAAKAVVYEGAGTVEFIVDGSKPLAEDTPFFFMEMNTRLQVEHPVTELVTGLDLVDLQFEVAAGEPLAMTQSDISLTGHAVEARVYAEDPENDFLPSAGRLDHVGWTDDPAVRIDTGVETGDAISQFYDPMIAKVIVYGEDRSAALKSLETALEGATVVGPPNNLAYLLELIATEPFVTGHYDTRFTDSVSFSGVEADQADQARAKAAAAWFFIEKNDTIGISPGGQPREWSPWFAMDGWQLFGARQHTIKMAFGGEIVGAIAEWDAFGQVCIDGHDPDEFAGMKSIRVPGGVCIVNKGRQWRYTEPEYEHASEEDASGFVTSPIQGTVVRIAVTPGDQVCDGDVLGIVEAMKMEHTLRAKVAGTVTDVKVGEGDQVAQHAPIVVIEPSV